MVVPDHPVEASRGTTAVPPLAPRGVTAPWPQAVSEIQVA
jgi:hypothetical protein